MSILVVAALALLGSPQEYYEPVTKLKREVESLRQSRAKVQAQIDETGAAIRRDPAGFYKAHAGECEVKGAKQADGSFDYVYLPMREWSAQKKRLSTLIAEKERELLDAYDQAIQRLAELERRLVNRWQAWGDSVTRLKAIDKDLKAGEEEWRRTMVMAGWDFVNEFIPAMKEGLSGMGVRLVRPPAGSFWATVSPEIRSKLRHGIEALEESSSLLNHATKAVLEGVDAGKEKDADQAGRKTIKAARELTDAMADLLRDTGMIGKTKAELEEFSQARSAVGALVAIVSAGAEFAAGGRFDEQKKIALGEAATSIVKFACTFNPLTRSATLVYGTLAAGAETGIAASAWWSNYSARETNEENLAWARRMTQAAREDTDAVSARLKTLREERAVLAAREGR